ncbi:MAG TPA: aldo/keto reductase [Bacteroidota bacterium]|nr:aldo/keto reductase [Bacteroidota bacterium]
MHYRRLGKTGFDVSEISLGTWQVGGKWGTTFDHRLAERILLAAIDRGVNFIDTADVYSNGESERAVGKILKQVDKRIYVATKCGRQIAPHVNNGYTPAILRSFVEESLRRLNVECLDLIQLHCPPTEVYYRPEIFAEFDTLKREGKILNLGVSVEKVEEGVKALEFENVTSIQIIYNIFRQRPDERLFSQAKAHDVGIIVRVPLASGLLTGKFTQATQFGKDDHRFFNRHGEMFDRGETFAGVPYDTGLEAVRRLSDSFPAQTNLAHVALQWILMHDEVSCIIPGASSPEQVESNIQAAEFPRLDESELAAIQKIYTELVKPWVHHNW